MYTFLDSWGHVLSEKKKKVEKITNWQPPFFDVMMKMMNILNILRYKILRVQFLSDLKKKVSKYSEEQS